MSTRVTTGSTRTGSRLGLARRISSTCHVHRLASASKLVEQTQSAGLRLMSNFKFGQDYAETLKQWGQRFEEAWKEGRIQGFDAQFRKLWLFYLAYCEAGFRTARTNVVHLELQRAD